MVYGTRWPTPPVAGVVVTDPNVDTGTALDLEPGPTLVGLVVGTGGLLFLLDPLVGPLAVGEIRVRPIALSAVVLGVGFCLGAPVFVRRGHRLFGIAHGVFGLAWVGVAVGTAFGLGVVVVAAVILVVAGAGFLIACTRTW
ncbi:hypothetical protein [Haloplanus natans]|uniref:hypothetical protein n=1 Tax=Haloplanus natans TaxID=376171 RepID=UPI001B7FEE49|nr:hypothetical protein [Haloplanus natans]